MMSDSIYVVVDKNGKSPTKSAGRKDARKLLVYTTEGRAKAAIKTRFSNPEDYEIVEYIPKISEIDAYLARRDVGR